MNSKAIVLLVLVSFLAVQISVVEGTDQEVNFGIYLNNFCTQ